MKKWLLLILLFRTPLYSQDNRIIELSKQYYKAKNYSTLISNINSYIKLNIVDESEFLSTLYLYIGLAQFKIGNPVEEYHLKWILIHSV